MEEETPIEPVVETTINEEPKQGVYFGSEVCPRVHNHRGTDSPRISHDDLLNTLRYEIRSSSSLQYSNDTERTMLNVAYTKTKEIKVDFDGPIISMIINYDIKTSSAPNVVWGYLYINGVAIGAELGNATETYETKSQTITFTTPLKKGDLIQLYTKYDIGSCTAYVRNFRLYYDKFIIPPINFTSQDP